MSTFYISFQTWKEDKFHTPWEFWKLTPADKFKPRKNSGHYKIYTREQVADAFNSLDSNFLKIIEEYYKEGSKVATFIDSSDENYAKNSILKYFEDAEFDTIKIVNDEIKSKIIELFVNSKKNNQ